MTIELDRGAFMAWLQAMKSDAVAGECLDDCACPIARFLDQIGLNCSVGGDEITSFGGEVIDTPAWASKFLLAIDTDGGELRYGPITARECLEILESIPE